MKKLPKAAAALLMAAVMLLSACGPRGRSLNDTEKKDLSAQLTEYINRMDICGSVYAVYHGDVVLDIARGDYSGEGSDIVYAVASITKQFTATSIMQLYEQGKLDIDDKLGKYFPDYKYGDIISLRQLLSQRSGIPDYSVDSFDGAVWATCDNSDKKLRIDPDGSAREHIEAIRELYLSCDLLFEPGEMFYYSDSNFSLLAAIVERVSGKSYHEYVRDNIFEPLGLKTAAFIDDHSYPEGVTVAATDRQEFDYDYFDYKGVEFGCGDIMLSPADLYRWYRSFSGGKAVRESSYKLMTTNCSDEGEPGYGFGLMIADGDSKALYHYGWIPAYYSAVFMIPDSDVFVTVLTNHGKGYPHTVASNVTGYICKTVGIEISQTE